MGIKAGDRFYVSWVQNGKTSTIRGTVDANTLLKNLIRPTETVGELGFEWGNGYTGELPLVDKFDQKLHTPDGKAGLAIHSNNFGVDEQLAGVTFSFTDNQGNVNDFANAALEFKLYQRAENHTGDQSLTFHVGSEANVAIKVGLGDMRAHALGLEGNDGSKLLFVPIENANAAINVFDNALTMSLDQATSIGAVQQRLEYTAANLTTASENVQAAESVIRDADMAKEMTEYTKNNVLSQAAQAMLAQANQTASSVISLLQ